jgi:hypothetical protein
MLSHDAKQGCEDERYSSILGFQQVSTLSAIVIETEVVE